MAKKRKDLSGQLDGLFSDFGTEEDAKPEEEELGESQAIAEILGTGEAEPDLVEPVAAEPVEMPVETPAIDALLAAEPAIEAAEEAEQAPPAEVEPAEELAEVAAIDEL
ncbi:MAG: hypothetical protein AB8I69_23555, partial [Anaerolineae bacterium]